MSFHWQDMTINGTVYGLSHLKPFTLGVTPKAPGAPTFKLYVSFGCHTFSKEWDANDPVAAQITDDRRLRCFCPIRHGHSLHLPSIIHQGVTGKAYFSEQRNYLIVDRLPGMNGPYAVFFNLERAESREFDAAMFVVSAYEKPRLPKRMDAITFATLISKTVNGERVTRPPKK
jgi:hypothetical protein